MDNTILTVAIDAIKGRSMGNYTAVDTSNALRNAFVELNGGSTKISPKTFYKGTPLFSLIQELIPVIIEEGIKAENNPLFNLVDYRNISDGDLAEFDIEGDANFVVASVANGIQSVRRQRIVGGETIKVPTEMKIVRVYENLGRLLAGRIDFNKFVDGVAKAFNEYIVTAAYTALAGLTANTYNLDSTYVKSGSLDTDAFLELVNHVASSTGKKPVILGTKSAVRKLGDDVTYSAEQNSDLYNKGYIAKFVGTDVVALEQAHVPGTSDFALADDALWIVAADDKPIKVVNEGDGLLIERDATQNADLTQEYVYAQGVGVGVVCAAKLGYWNSIT
nr:MAG TPA: capsid protein [Caudoviricetes sp.]